MSGPINDVKTIYAAPGTVNTVNRRVIPVIVVPGVMGTRLRLGEQTITLPSIDPRTMERRRFTVRVAWDPDSRLEMFKLVLVRREGHDALCATLNSQVPATITQKHDAYSAEQNRRGWGELPRDFYGGVLGYLDGLRLPGVDVPVYGVGYDWRQDIRDIRVGGAKRLKERVNEILSENANAEEVILVTHSMGGLVARWAMKHEGLEKSVLGVIHCGQPAAGAVEFYLCCRQGAGVVHSTTYREGALEWAMGYFLGSTNGEFCRLMSGLPGPVQLITSDQYKLDRRDGRKWLRYRPGGRRQDDHYKQVRLCAWERSVWEAYLDETEGVGIMNPADYTSTVDSIGRMNMVVNILRARQFYEGLQCSPEPASLPWFHPRTINLYGNRPRYREHVMDTVVAVDCNFPVQRGDTARSRNSTIWYGRGDGTVPVSSARLPDLNQRDGPLQFSALLDHGQFLLHPEVIRRVEGAIRLLSGMDYDNTRKAFRDGSPHFEDQWLTRDHPGKQVEKKGAGKFEPRIIVLGAAHVPKDSILRKSALQGGIHSITILRDYVDLSYEYLIQGEVLSRRLYNAPRYNEWTRAFPDASKIAKTYDPDGSLGFKDYVKAHLWGPGFGDEAAAGIMYTPAMVNRFQNQTIEEAIREVKRMASRINGKLYLEAMARSHPQGDSAPTALQRRYKILAEVSYVFRIVAPSGETAEVYPVGFSVKPPPSGEIYDINVCKEHDTFILGDYCIDPDTREWADVGSVVEKICSRNPGDLDP